MDTLEKELQELKTFIADLKADRQSQKDKEKRESWTKYTSMSLVFIAVFAAIATQWAGKYSSRTLVALNDSTFNQALASDQWGYYQASSIKRNLYETIHALPLNQMSADAAETAKREQDFKDKVKKYTDNQNAAQTKAEEKEAARQKARDTATESSRRGSAMGMVTSIFQISIAMGSICLVAKKKWLWYVSLALAALGSFAMVLVWVNIDLLQKILGG